MAEIKDKLITVDSLKCVYDELKNIYNNVCAEAIKADWVATREVSGGEFVIETNPTTFGDESNWVGFFSANTAGTSGYELVVGETYAVYWQDKHYVRIAYDNINGELILGNHSIIDPNNGEDTGEPFCIHNIEGRLEVYKKEVCAETIMFGIIKNPIYDYNKLPYEYLPTNEVATSIRNGFMSAEDKAKLDSIEEGANSVTELPSVTTSDNGAFLRVVNGKWSAATIANAEGVGF